MRKSENIHETRKPKPASRFQALALLCTSANLCGTTPQPAARNPSPITRTPFPGSCTTLHLCQSLRHKPLPASFVIISLCPGRSVHDPQKINPISDISTTCDSPRTQYTDHLCPL